MMLLFKKFMNKKQMQSPRMWLSKQMRLSLLIKIRWMMKLKRRALPPQKEDRINSIHCQLIWSKTWMKCLMNSYQSIFNKTWVKSHQLSRKMEDLLKSISSNRSKCISLRMTLRKSRSTRHSSKNKELRSSEIVDAKLDRHRWSLQTLTRTHQAITIKIQIWTRVYPSNPVLLLWNIEIKRITAKPDTTKTWIPAR